MTAIQMFENLEFGTITTAVADGKTYFAATECAMALGYTNPEKAIRDHCKLMVNKTFTIKKPVISHGKDTGQTRDVPVQFISEGDLFRLIVKSRIPAAERFERLVFDEILPTIRRTGGYGAIPSPKPSAPPILPPGAAQMGVLEFVQWIIDRGKNIENSSTN